MLGGALGVILALSVGLSRPASSAPAGPDRGTLAARCRAEAQAIRNDSRAGLSVVVAPPFVVAGELPGADLARWTQRTILPAAERLLAKFFARRPGEPVVIYLFRDEPSYRRFAKDLFGDVDVPHFGYYKPKAHTLVMNIATGGGTLVHELTHALVDFDFPRIPEWFNEGLASLYEQCRFDRQDIVGLTNWRLPALQRALAEGRLRPLGRLITAGDFHGPTEGLNYAQARYFCMYMQSEGVLERFYKTFRDRFERDPTGLRFVEEVFGGRSIEQIDRRYRAWLRTLRWPESQPGP